MTKAGGGYLSVAPGVVRVQLVTDFLGETGHGASAAAQWFALVALVGASLTGHSRWRAMVRGTAAGPAAGVDAI